MFSLIKSLYTIYNGDSGDDNHYDSHDDDNNKDRYRSRSADAWMKLIKKNSEHFTFVIDWEFKYCDVIVFNCSQYEIIIEHNDKTVKVWSYLGCEGEAPRYVTFKSNNHDSNNILNIKNYDDSVIINKQLCLQSKTVVYLQNSDLVSSK